MINVLLLAGLLGLLPQPQTQQKYALGLEATTTAQFEKSPRIRLRATRAASDRPKRLVLEEFLPPVGDQASQGSCVGWSTAYYAYTYAVAKQRGFDKPMIASPKWQFSPAFLYHQRDKKTKDGKEREGMSVYEAMKILVEKGCASLAEMPYSDKDGTTPPPQNAFARAEKFKALKNGIIFFHLSDPNSKLAKEIPQSFDPENIKQLMHELRQPIVITIPVYENFQSADPNSVYTHSGSDKSLGGHAICIIGYDDDKKAFRMVNSWTDKWGDKGQLWLSEEWLKKEAEQAWMFIAGGGWSRKKPGEKDRPGENWQSVLEIQPPVAATKKEAK
jgi:C1A family cysteine protease